MTTPALFPALARRLALAAIATAVVMQGAMSATGRSFRYDAAGRLILAVYDDGTALRYTYTFGDNILSVRRLRLPPAPAGLVAERTEPSTATLTWFDRSQDESGFVVMRRDAESSAWSTVATLPPNSVSFADRELVAGRNYVYRVSAMAETDANGLRSAYTAEAAAGESGGIGFSITSFHPLSDAGPGPFVLTFEGNAQVTYHLESSDTLETGSWQPEPWSSQPNQPASLAPIPGREGPVTIYLENTPSVPARYFRVRLVSP